MRFARYIYRDFCAIDNGKLGRSSNPGSGWVEVIESYPNEFFMCHFLRRVMKLEHNSLSK